MDILSTEQFESALIARHGLEIHKKLRAAVVAVAGLGGLGSNVAVALARIGIGKLILADFDVVDPSNLNRQQYFIDQLEKPKTAALLENLMRINPYVEYKTFNVRITPDNIVELFGGIHIIAECFDRADQKQMLVENVLTKLQGAMIFSASGMAGFGNSNAIKTRRINDRLIMVGDFVTGASPQNGLMAPRVALTAAHQANAIVEYIITGKVNTEVQ
jgi:sulfur carrier protein ThiS adenylyltransferase